MANMNSATPNSREQSIMNESIDFTEYEEPDTAVNKHLAAGQSNGSANGAGSNEKNGSSSSSSLSTTAVSEEDSVHIHTIEQAMARLKQLDADGEWEKVTAHERGVTVHVRKSVVNVAGKQKKVPLFRGEKFIQGFSPEQVFEVVGRRSLWDDWYDSGNLVADLNNSTSMTYMNMRVPGTARPRDLALIERVEASSDGTIYFAATSIETSKVPHVHGRTRAQMVLNGWVLRPFQQNGHPGTWCLYYLQIDPHGLTPFPLATKMVSKRLAHIYKIEDYLKKHGQPRSAGTGQTQRNTNGQTVAGAGAGAATLAPGTAAQHHAGPSHHNEETGSDLPPQVPFNEKHPSAQDVLQAKAKLEQLLSSQGTWDKAVDPQGNPLYTQTVQGSSLPIMKGEAKMPSGITTEQVLGTIMSTAARRIWNEHLQDTQLLECINGIEQCIRKDTYKGIHPHLPSRTYTLAQGVFRSEASSDHGNITYVSTSSGKTARASEGSNHNTQSTLEYAGFQISSSSSHDQVTLVNAIKVDLEKQDLPEFVKRILIYAYAGAPAKVGECIKTYGHAPFFLRWGPGRASLQGESEGDLRKGRFVWKVADKGNSAENTSSSEQIAWLQYSDVMYPNGIALSSSAPAEAVKVAKVQGHPNTIQLTFMGSLPLGDMKLEANRHHGSSCEDVLWNDEAVSQSVAPPRGSGSARRAPTIAAPAAAVAATKSTEQRDTSPTSRAQNNSTAAQDVSPTTSRQLAKVSETATDLATVHRVPVDSKGRRQLPDDAMLILTQDLYFTRSQMALITTLLLLVWSAARYL